MLHDVCSRQLLQGESVVDEEAFHPWTFAEQENIEGKLTTSFFSCLCDLPPPSPSMCIFPAQNRLAVWPGSSCLPLFPPLDKGNKGSDLESPGPWPCLQCAWWNDSVALTCLSPHTHITGAPLDCSCVSLSAPVSGSPHCPWPLLQNSAHWDPVGRPSVGFTPAPRENSVCSLEKLWALLLMHARALLRNPPLGILSTSVSLHEALQHLIAGRRPKPIRVTSPPLCQEWMHLSGPVHSIRKSLILWKFHKKGSFRVARQPLGFLTFLRDSSLPPASLSVITA